MYEEKGWSFEELVRRTGYSAKTLDNWLKGRTRAGPELLKKIADVLKLPIEDVDSQQQRPEILRDDSSPYGAGSHHQEAFEWVLRNLPEEQLKALYDTLWQNPDVPHELSTLITAALRQERINRKPLVDRKGFPLDPSVEDAARKGLKHKPE